MTKHLPTTEAGVWITLPFKIGKRDQNMSRRAARQRAIHHRRMGRLARVVRLPNNRWGCAWYQPRRYQPRPIDLIL